MADLRLQTTFERALKEYLDGLPPDKSKAKFIKLCEASMGAPCSNPSTSFPQMINESIQKVEKDKTKCGTTMKVFGEITKALKDYSEVIGQLVSVQPLPFAIIWGAVKVVVESSDRCRAIFESMDETLNDLVTHIHDMNKYNTLYGDSQEMQSHFFQCYILMVRFWHRVHKECNRSSRFTQGLSSKALNKIKGMIADLDKIVKKITTTGSLLEAQFAKNERDCAQDERTQAHHERLEQSEWRSKQDLFEYERVCGEISKALCPIELETTNSKKYDALKSHYEKAEKQTFAWLENLDAYRFWTLSSSESSLLCLRGPPGYGKSVLTSYAVDKISQEAAVAYLFCHHGQQCDSVRDILRLFAYQLFYSYRKRSQPVRAIEMHRWASGMKVSDFQELITHLVDILDPTYFFIDGLDEYWDPNGKNSSYQPVKEVLEFLIKLSDSVKPKQVRIWYSLRKQERKLPGYDAIDKHQHQTIEIDEHTEDDVQSFIREGFEAIKSRLEEHDQLDDRKDACLLDFARVWVEGQAYGHFLWARLMVDELEAAQTVQEIVERVKKGPPESINELYQSIFNRIRKEDRDIASKATALVMSSRRSLKLAEIHEAVCLLLGKKRRDIVCKMSMKTFVLNLPALIEVDKEPEPNPGSTMEGRTCRLLHSSVLEFLREHPDALGEENRISSFSIADVCLRYLSMPRFAEPLQKRVSSSSVVTWRDSKGGPVDVHHFARYAAKNWAKHLEEIIPEDQARIQKRLEGFVASPNFQTCLQMQSLWVDGKFDVYWVEALNRICTLRIFPQWMLKSREPELSRLWRDYRFFIHDWRILLSCGDCYSHDPDCSFLEHRGEVDRCWWQSLGDQNFMSKLKNRYTSFRLMDDSGEINKSEFYEGRWSSDTTNHFMVLRLVSWDHTTHKLHFICEDWTLHPPPKKPVLTKRQEIITTESDTNWALYAKGLPNASTKIIARPAAFSEDCSYLRIGAQVFYYDDDGDYQPVPGLMSGLNFPRYFEDLSSQGRFLAISSRAYTQAQYLDESTYLENLGHDFLCMETKERDSNSDWDSESESDWDRNHASDSASTRTSGSESEVGIHESWSEGSTDEDELPSDDSSSSDPSLEDSDSESSASSLDSDTKARVKVQEELVKLALKIFLERESRKQEKDKDADASSESSDTESEPEDIEVEPASPVEGNDADNESAEEKLSENLTAINSDAGSQSDQESDPDSDVADVLSPSAWGAEDSDDEEWVWNQVLTERVQDGFNAGSQPAQDPRMLLSVFDFDSHTSSLKKLFEITYPLSFMLYGSPPMIHPERSLIVWPLGGGDVLFADFKANSYFVRKLRPSASFTRHISMKLHFSPCGQFLHIASIEARSKPSKSDKRPPLDLSLFLSTYKLSHRKTTRCPPTLIHRAKLNVGSYTSITVSRLPFTLTWTPSELYFTQSDRVLRIFRVALFPDGPPGSQPSIHVPSKPTFLPDTAVKREVFFFPPAGSKKTACIVVGGETRMQAIKMEKDPELQVDKTLSPIIDMQGALSPPVGCFVDVKKDMSGWARAEDVPRISKGIGKLDSHREKFDPEDDCDVEPYFQN
ncbi:hypothetical protein BDN72DRAFT_836341 [Pluteus cervinus]|uniref:Uncharacterized protein n=1 Tax=Pluteus cervinus TaxID=181527 RepID=A0ACD3B2Z8_9AGAR|nr:hypothetical protein BDN72DRAFT_836341 [Pluteus cervinus]